MELMHYQIGQKVDGQTSPQKKSILKLLIVSAAIWLPILLFVLLAAVIRSDKPLPGDVAILDVIHRLASPTLNSFMIHVTDLGDAKAVIVGVGLASGVLFLIRRRRQAFFLGFSAAGTAAINQIFKHIFRRDRPELWKHLVNETSFSFPSGHAMISSAIALTVVILCWRTKFRVPAIIIGALYMLVISFSRLYLGVHYPSDVFAGWCVSTVWVIALLFVCIRFGWDPTRRTKHSDSDPA